MSSTHLTNNYGNAAVRFERGARCELFDDNGDAWFDALSGIGVVNLGHNHPEVNAAIVQQLSTLDHISNLYDTGIRDRAADALCKVAGMERVFFSNSGTEANEAAVKLARLHGQQTHGNAGTILAFDNAFHGRSMGALAATGKDAIKAPFAPLLPGFLHTPYNDIQALELAFEHNQIDAVIVEVIQGEAGVINGDQEFLVAIQTLCDRHNALFMVDEVQTGNCRTGKWYAHQHFNLTPDVITTAKGLGNGFPVGATLVNHRAKDLFYPGSHGSTYGGNPMACAAIKSVIDVMERDDINAHVSKASKALRSNLLALDGVKAVDGMGLMLGIQLASEIEDLAQKANNEKLLVNVINASRIRLLPPLIVNDTDINTIVERIENIITS